LHLSLSAFFDYSYTIILNFKIIYLISKIKLQDCTKNSNNYPHNNNNISNCNNNNQCENSEPQQLLMNITSINTTNEFNSQIGYKPATNQIVRLHDPPEMVLQSQSQQNNYSLYEHFHYHSNYSLMHGSQQQLPPAPQQPHIFTDTMPMHEQLKQFEMLDLIPQLPESKPFLELPSIMMIDDEIQSNNINNSHHLKNNNHLYFPVQDECQQPNVNTEQSLVFTTKSSDSPSPNFLQRSSSSSTSSFSSPPPSYTSKRIRFEMVTSIASDDEPTQPGISLPLKIF